MSTPAIDFSQYEGPPQIDFSKYSGAPNAGLAGPARPNLPQPSTLDVVATRAANMLPIATAQERTQRFNQMQQGLLEGDVDKFGVPLPSAAQTAGMVTGPVRTIRGGDVAGGLTELGMNVAQQAIMAKAAGRVSGTQGTASEVSGAQGGLGEVARAAPRAVQKTTGFLSDVVSPDITGVFSPRLANLQKVLGRFSDALGNRLDNAVGAEPGGRPPTPLPSLPELTAVQADVASALRNQGYTAQAAEHWARQTTASDFDTAFREAAGAAKPLVTQQFSRPASQSSPSRADILDDKAVEEAMRVNLEQHGQSAYREAGQQARAASSVDTPKWQMAAEFKAKQILDEAQAKIQDVMTAAEKMATTPKKYTQTPAPTAPEDLVQALEDSIAAARAAKTLAGEK